MRVPLSWLREFVDVQLTPEQLADALTLRGLEVRGLERWGGNWGLVRAHDRSLEHHRHGAQLEAR